MSLTATAADLQAEKTLRSVLKKTFIAKKAITYLKLIGEVVDEKTRSGAVLKLGLQASLDVGRAVLGRSLTSNPFYQYHKIHIHALADMLNALRQRDKMVDAFNRAVASADSTVRVKGVLSDTRQRVSDLLGIYMFMEDSLRLLGELKLGVATPQTTQELKENGMSYQDVLSVEKDLLTYRAKWSQLYFEMLELLVMVQIELFMAEAAMVQYRAAMKTLMSGSNLSKVTGLATLREQQIDEFYRMKDPTPANPEMAFSDPVRYATIQRDSVFAVAAAMAEVIDFVAGDDVGRRAAGSAQAALLVKELASYK